jgi:hypothetical protein
MNKLLVVKSALLVVAVVCLLAALAGCGGGGGSAGGGFSGALEGSVFVPGGRSGVGATYLATDRSGPPTGYEPLPGATVTATINGTDYTTTTDANGYFLISHLPSGKATIRITPPSGSSYGVFTASADIVNGGRAVIGQDGSVSLLTGTATNLGVTVNSLDVSAWPSVRLYVSVLDPKANTAIIGMSAADFTLLLNGASVGISGVSTEMTTGSNPRQVYVLTATGSGPSPTFVKADLTAAFCGKAGSATMTISNAASFVAPLSVMTVSNAFKAAGYAVDHPGKWHMGADIPAAINVSVKAIARGEVVGVFIAGQNGRVIVKHRVSSDLTTAGGTTRDIYVVYGCILPATVMGAVVEAGQQIGIIVLHGEGDHLHLGIRVGQAIDSPWDDGPLVAGAIPAADAFGLTDGWVDPIAFMAGKTPDNSWTP